MKNMNEAEAKEMTLKEKLARAIGKVLVRQTEAETKFSIPFIVYEPDFPKEILLEEAE